MPDIKALFIPGPTNVPQAVRLAMDISMVDQRAPDLPAFTLPLFEDVKKIFKSRDGQFKSGSCNEKRLVISMRLRVFCFHVLALTIEAV